MATVLLVSFLDTFSFKDHYDVLDFFAGAARLARASRFAGPSPLFASEWPGDIAGALDITYSANPHTYDINEDAGFACPRSAENSSCQGALNVPLQVEGQK